MIFKRFLSISVALCFSLKAVSSSFVLVPLYANPTDAAFQSYLNSFVANPNINFKVIINPSSGPGTATYPSSLWIAAIAKIRTYPNVQMLGYVHTSSATRLITAVTADIAVYANWDTYLPANITLDGIFFDEAPATWTAATSIYMTTAVAATTLVFELTPYIFFNPGVPVDIRFYNLANNILVWENSYSAYSMAAIAAIPFVYASKSTVVIHGFSGSTKDQTQAVKALSSYGISGIFISDMSSYSAFSNIWAQFCQAIAG